MLKLDTIRGHHSTGVMYVEDSKRSDPKIVKALGTPWDMIKEKPDEYFNGSKNGVISGNMLCMIGHNRWATVGNIEEKNAHPFVADDLVGVQNGTIPDHYRRKLKDWDKYDTDTEALFNNIASDGLDVFKNITGAWALMWWDKKEHSFNFMRNDQRPLYYAWKKGGHVLFLASEADFIYYACEKHNVKIENDLCYRVTKDTLFNYKVGKQHEFSEKLELSYEVPKYEFKGYSVTHSPTGGMTKTSPGGNVVPFKTHVQQVFSGSLQDGVNHWQKAVGSFKEFALAAGEWKDEQGKPYKLGHTLDGNVCVRIYPSDKVDLSKILGDKTVSTYSAKVKRVKTNGKRFYLLMDLDNFYVASRKAGFYKSPDTIHLIEEAKEARVTDRMFTFVTAHNNELIDADEFKRRVKTGCCWCSQVPDVREHEEVNWLSKTDFLCSDCNSDADITQYVSQMAVGL